MSNTNQPAPGSVIKPPADFSVAWRDPADVKITWMLNSRAATPMKPLVYAVLDVFTVGGNVGYESVGLPFVMRTSHINTYEYLGAVMTGMPPEAMMKFMGLLSKTAPGVFKTMMGKASEGMSKKQLAAANPIVARLDVYWRDELLPEMKQHIAYFESSNLRGMSLDQLRAHLAEAMKRVERMGGLHMLAVLPSLFAMSKFEELYRELFSGATTLDALRLTQGFDNKTMEADRALWQLSRDAKASPSAHKALIENAPREVVPALEKTDEGHKFLARLRGWLNQYGQRLDSAFVLDEPSWLEDPSAAIACIQSYIAQDDAQPEADQAKRVAERERAIADARSKLQTYPQPVREQFEMLLKAAQTAAVIHEDHNFWIDQRMFYHVRRIALEFGRRMSESGAIETVDDVFYLTPDELRAIAADANGSDFRGMVRDRKTDMVRFSRVKPPSMLGTTPPFDVADGGPVLRAFFKGDFNPNESANGDARVVKGLAGSAGVVRGKARLIRALSEAGKLAHGEVLVTESTAPPWTPLFATAAAVVTDIGGVLSHSAVVAREYGIPAVVGTGKATATIKDGQVIEVDGNAGLVRIL